MNWNNVKKHKPEFNKLVHVAHHVMGIGAPEREGWTSKGRLRESGRWSINYVPEIRYEFEVTHWKEIVDTEIQAHTHRFTITKRKNESGTPIWVCECGKEVASM